MRTFVEKVQRSVPTVRKAHRFAHHPTKTVQQVMIHRALRSSGVQAKHPRSQVRLVGE